MILMKIVKMMMMMMRMMNLIIMMSLITTLNKYANEKKRIKPKAFSTANSSLKTAQANKSLDSKELVIIIHAKKHQMAPLLEIKSIKRFMMTSERKYFLEVW